MTLQPVITKIRAPRFPRGRISRREISNPLTGDRFPKLVWISAPAGYGKTSLALEWTGPRGASADSPESVSTAWYSLEDDDNDLNRFVTYLVAAIQEVDSSFGANFRLITSSSLPVDFDSVFTAIVNELARRESPMTIVLDDLHEIGSSEVLGRIDWLVHHLPDNVCMVATSRESPPFDVAKLRIAGDLIEIGTSELSLSETEAIELFKAINPGSDPGVAASINRSARGWFAAVALAANTASDASAEPSGPGSGEVLAFERIFDYYAEEVVDAVGKTTRDLLISCSILDSFSAELAEHLSGQSRTIDLLEAVADTRMLVDRVNGLENWYRFHPLMKEFLSRQSLDAGRVEKLHLSAADWFRRNGDPVAAFDHALKGLNPELAADILDGSALDIFFGGGATTVIRMTDRLPHELAASRPQLCVGRAYAHVMRFEFDDARTNLSLAESAVHPGPRLGKKQRDHDPLGDKRIAGQIAAAWSSIATFERDLETCIRWGQEAIDLLGPNHPEILEIAHVSIATAYWGQGNLGMALEAFQQVARGGSTAEITLLRYMSTCNAGHVMIELGRLDEAIAIFQSVLDDSAGSSREEPPFAALAYNGLAEVALQRGDSQLAENHSQRAIKLAESWGSAEVTLAGMLIAARATLDQGDLVTSGRVIAEAMDLATTGDNNWWIGRIDSQIARFAARRGEPNEFSIPESALAVSYENIFDSLTYAEVLIARRKSAMAGALIDQIEAFAAEGGYRGAVANAKALRLLSAVKAGTPADNLLQDAVATAASNRTWRSVLKLGPDLSRFISDNRKKIESAGASELLTLIDGTSASGRIVETFGLSDREREVLKLICDGLSNIEIGNRLVVAPGTIKTHINRLYRKIDVSTRAQAVAWAVQVGLFTRQTH